MHANGSLLECVDSRLGPNFDTNQVFRILHLALACLHLDSNLRPRMRKVIQILNNPEEPLIEVPSTCLKQRLYVSLNELSSAQSVANFNQSFTTLEPRT